MDTPNKDETESAIEAADTAPPAADVTAELEAKHALEQQRDALTKNFRAAAEKAKPPIAVVKTSPAPAPAQARATRDDRARPTITLALLRREKACAAGLRTFAARAAELGDFHPEDIGDADGFVWSEAEVQRLHRINPRFLFWYEAKGLVPMLEAEGVPSVAERAAAIATKRREVMQVRSAHLARFAPAPSAAKGSP